MLLTFVRHWALIATTTTAVLLTALTFGHPLMFDRLYILVLLCAAIVCFFHDKNMWVVVLIILTQRLSEELLWLLLSDSWNFKLPSYAICLGLCCRLHNDALAKLAIIAIALMLLSETYWLYTDYPAPQIVWYAILTAINVLIRYLLFGRPALISQYTPQLMPIEQLRWLAIDFQLHKVAGVFTLLALLTCAEFLVRHILGYPIIWIYTLKPYLAQLCSGFILWLILKQTLQLIHENQLNA